MSLEETAAQVLWSLSSLSGSSHTFLSMPQQRKETQLWNPDEGVRNLVPMVSSRHFSRFWGRE